MLIILNPTIQIRSCNLVQGFILLHYIYSFLYRNIKNRPLRMLLMVVSDRKFFFYLFILFSDNFVNILAVEAGLNSHTRHNVWTPSNAIQYTFTLASTIGN